jgi:SnoaL-like domain
MTKTDLQELAARLSVIEDELSIRRLILSYGPAADAALADRAAAAWQESGVYDWDAAQAPHEGRTAIAEMLRTDGHLGLVGHGVAHFAGPPLIDVKGDRAIALTYSLIMRRDEDAARYYLWRVSAARWDLERDRPCWSVRRRTHRLLDETGAGSELFGEALQDMFHGSEC